MKKYKSGYLILAVLLLVVIFSTQTALATGTGSEKTGRTIMIVSPHQDDEANIANAIMYSHQKKGDEVYVVMAFGSSRNDEMDSYGKNRLKESKNNLQMLGIPAENLIYLGYQKIDHAASYYSDGVLKLDENGAMLRAASGQPFITYGGANDEYPSYHLQRYGEQWTATEEHLKSDLKDVLMEYRPDELYVINYDLHIEHMYLASVTDTAFGEVMQELAARGETYQPRYYQSMSYQTAWQAVADLESTISPSDENRIFLESTLRMKPRNPTFAWEERVRFPVEEEMSEPSLKNNLSAKAYVSFTNGGGVTAKRIAACVNGDQVVWERDCRSLAYDAAVTVSSNEEEARQLNDFCTLRMHMVDFLSGASATALKFNDYRWCPEADDHKPWVRLTFPEPRHIGSIKLYDDYKTENQIMAGSLVFSNGSEIPVGPLNDNGSATLVSFDPIEDVEWVEFQISEYRGKPALTEFEVYGWGDSQTVYLINKNGDIEGIEEYWLGTERQMEFIQIFLDQVEGKDWANKSFLYRYPIDASAQTRTVRLGVYGYPGKPEIIEDRYRWSLEGGIRQGISLTQEGLLTVGREAVTGEYAVTVASMKNPRLTDTVILDVKASGTEAETFTLSGSFQNQGEWTSDCMISVYRFGGGLQGELVIPVSEQVDGFGYYEITGVPAGRYNLIFRQENGASYKLSDVTVNGDRQLGCITLANPGRADCNGDGIIDYKDIAIVLMGLDGYDLKRADANGSGKVDRNDLEAVLYKLY